MIEHTERLSERLAMIETQLRGRGLRDARVLAAMTAVPRECFVPERYVEEAYADSALPIGEGQTISQPYMVARTCELAGLRGHERVLEVGAGSGYQAAVLAQLAKEVVAIERIGALALRAEEALGGLEVDNVTVVTGDGTKGYPPRAPYDAIVVAAGAPYVPQSLIDQLAEGGRLVIPVGMRYKQRLSIIEKRADGLHEEERDACVFVPLVGDEGYADDDGVRTVR